MVRIIRVKQSVLESILSYAKLNHPNECIALLRGKRKKDAITIESLVLPPMAFHGEDSSSFQPYMLPMDLSILGVVHSHPNGNPTPSYADLNNFYGRVMFITVYPYAGPEDVVAYTREGLRINYETIE